MCWVCLGFVGGIKTGSKKKKKKKKSQSAVEQKSEAITGRQLVQLVGFSQTVTDLGFTVKYGGLGAKAVHFTWPAFDMLAESDQVVGPEDYPVITANAHLTIEQNGSDNSFLTHWCFPSRWLRPDRN